MLPADPFRFVSAVVAIPIRNEAERIADCLMALARQAGGAHAVSPGIVLLVNNTMDATMAVVAEVAGAVSVPIVAIEHVFPGAEASAGAARRLAMQHADRLAPGHAPLLTTDADGRAAPDWLQANLRAIDHGADAVFGRAIIDPEEAARIPPAQHRADAQEQDYAAALDEIAHWLGPDPADPWPRHAEHSGASIAVRREAFRGVGGMPALPLGEDRAFATALRRAGARIRHAPEVQVVVSGRILGRAVGGMADTIRRRLVTPDVLLDAALEPVAARLRRLRLHRAVHRAFAAGGPRRLDPVAAAAGLRRGALAGAEDAWAACDRIDRVLVPQRVPVADVPEQMAVARRLLTRLRRPAALPILA